MMQQHGGWEGRGRGERFTQIISVRITKKNQTKPSIFLIQ